MKLIETLTSIFSSPPKELKMVWQVEKNGRLGYLAGTAHFFPYRLKTSLQRYIQETRFVLFEGPLDEKGMSRVVKEGAEGGGVALFEGLDPATIQKIKKATRSLFEPSGALPLLLPFTPHFQDPLEAHFLTRRPWMAFFQVWYHFLGERGWKHSVDLEAMEIAIRKGKEVVFLETIEEQIAGLEGIPLERFIHFFKKIDQWDEWAHAHLEVYLRGDMESLLGATQEFPTRCPSIVDQRDPVLFERMKPYFEEGKVIAFVGTIHIPGIQKRLLAEGYSIRQVARGNE
jgi:uncharacterized protein YbaP (TraB family)